MARPRPHELAHPGRTRPRSSHGSPAPRRPSRRCPRRPSGSCSGLLRGANATMALALTLLGVLTALGRASIGLILIVTFLVGSARALQQVTQQAHAHDLVGAARLTEALGALGIAMRIGGLTGSLLTGGLIGTRGPARRTWPPPPASLLAALILPGGSSHGARPPTTAGSILEGLSGFLAAARAVAAAAPLHGADRRRRGARVLASGRAAEPRAGRPPRRAGGPRRDERRATSGWDPRHAGGRPPKSRWAAARRSLHRRAGSVRRGRGGARSGIRLRHCAAPVLLPTSPAR